MIRAMETSDILRASEIKASARRQNYLENLSDEYFFGEISISIAKIEKQLAESISDKETQTYVYDSGIIKGFITIGPCHDEDKKGVLELWNIYVDPIMQRQGIGTALIRFFEETAKGLGYNEICLRTLNKNLSAQSFYNKSGYICDGKIFANDYFKKLNVHNIRYIKEI